MTSFGSISGIEHLRIWDGITAQAIEGDRTTLAVIALEPNSTVPEHHHDNEQLGVLVRGAMTFRIGDETRELSAGDTWRILSHVPHEVTAGPDGALAVECFTPARADWAGLERVPDRPAPRLV
jgi:quercetin dioxygenase-like cupin family protein